MFHVRKVGVFTAAVAALSLVGVLAAQAQTTVLPSDEVPPLVVSPPFGPVAPGGVATTEYKGFGLILSDRGAAGPAVDTAIFSDPPDAWGGVNPSGDVDLLSPIDGRFSVPGTTDAAVTDFLEVEAGFSSPGTLELDAYSLSGALLASVLNVDGTGPHGRSLMTIALPGIASFRVWTPLGDTFGVDQVRFNTPTSPVPEPGTLAMFAGMGLSGLAVLRRVRK